MSAQPDPQRLLKAYNQSASTLNLLRAFASGGYADLHNIHRWTLGFVGDQPVRARSTRELAEKISEALAFMEAVGVTPESHPDLASVWSSSPRTRPCCWASRRP